MKMRNMLKKYGPAAGVLTLALVGSPAFAAGEIDTSDVIGYIAAGVVAAGLITGAMLGLVALIGVGKKTQRAGT